MWVEGHLVHEHIVASHAHGAFFSLQVTEKGLTAEQHKQRLAEYGPNKLPEGTRNPILVYLGCSAMALHMAVAATRTWSCPNVF